MLRCKLGLHRLYPKHSNAKLTEEDVFKIKQLLAKGVYHKNIAKLFSVSRTNITLIANGKTWRNTDV